MLFNKPLEEVTDLELLWLYKQTGEMEALGLLYTRYTPLIYGVCLKYLKDRNDAQDAVMNIFEKLVSILLDHEVSYFKSWLYVTARNHCLMQLRGNKGKETQELSPFLMESGGVEHPEDAAEMERNLVKLEECIKKLAIEQQRCVSLFFLKLKCYRDIVEETGFELKKVKSYIQNGKRNLKICMENND